MPEDNASRACLQLGDQVLSCMRHRAPVPAEQDGGLQCNESTQRAHDITHTLVKTGDLSIASRSGRVSASGVLRMTFVLSLINASAEKSQERSGTCSRSHIIYMDMLDDDQEYSSKVRRPPMTSHAAHPKHGVVIAVARCSHWHYPQCAAITHARAAGRCGIEQVGALRGKGR
jgi:hypothetical protein